MQGTKLVRWKLGQTQTPHKPLPKNGKEQNSAVNHGIVLGTLPQPSTGVRPTFSLPTLERHRYIAQEEDWQETQLLFFFIHRGSVMQLVTLSATIKCRRQYHVLMSPLLVRLPDTVSRHLPGVVLN